MKGTTAVFSRSILLISVVTSLVLGGCAMPAQVRPPRTLDAGRLEQSVGLRLATAPALERSDTSLGFDLGEDFNPMGVTPTYALRYGLLDWLEIGGEVNLGYARAESSVQLLRTRALDLAVGLDAGFAFEDLEGDVSSRFAAAVPLTVGWNVSRSVTVIAMGAPAAWSNGFFVQVGGGLDLRLGSVSLRPTFAQMISVDHDQPLVHYEGGSVGPAYGTGTFYLLGLDIALGGERGYGRSGIF